MPKEKVRIAVVGAGHVAQIAHMPAYRNNKSAELVALVDEDPIKGEKLRDQFGFKCFYEDFTEMIAKEENFIARFKARVSHAAQVQSRIKKLDKIERIEYNFEKGKK